MGPRLISLRAPSASNQSQQSSRPRFLLDFRGAVDKQVLALVGDEPGARWKRRRHEALEPLTAVAAHLDPRHGVATTVVERAEGGRIEGSLSGPPGEDSCLEQG